MTATLSAGRDIADSVPANGGTVGSLHRVQNAQLWLTSLVLRALIAHELASDPGVATHMTMQMLPARPNHRAKIHAAAQAAYRVGSVPAHRGREEKQRHLRC